MLYIFLGVLAYCVLGAATYVFIIVSDERPDSFPWLPPGRYASQQENAIAVFVLGCIWPATLVAFGIHLFIRLWQLRPRLSTRVAAGLLSLYISTLVAIRRIIPKKTLDTPNQEEITT